MTSANQNGSDAVEFLSRFGINSDDSLQHWGIKGQKWGIRRFQNEDGTLTEEGKKRYNKNTDFKSEYNNAFKRHEGNINALFKKYPNGVKILNGKLAFDGPDADKLIDEFNAEVDRLYKELDEIDDGYAEVYNLDRKKLKSIRSVSKIAHDGMLDEDFLAHHGILGQKWGVRRFQNDDGTLTEAGRLRYQQEEKIRQEKVALKEKKRQERRQDRKERGYDVRDFIADKVSTKLHSAKRSRLRDAKHRRDLSDAELQQRIARLESEKKLKNLTEEELSPGRKYVKDILGTSGKTVLTMAASAVGIYAVLKGAEAYKNYKNVPKATYLGKSGYKRTNKDRAYEAWRNVKTYANEYKNAWDPEGLSDWLKKYAEPKKK